MSTSRLGNALWGLSYSMGLLVLGGSVTASALPTAQEVYRNDAINVVLYRDSEEARIYWYVPQIEVSPEFHRRQRADGNTEYSFYLVPRFSNQLVDYLVGEVPGLSNRSQLKPVVARKFSIQLKHFAPAVQGSAVSEELVNDYRYINQPQLVRLVLNADQVEDFELLFNASPGVPVQTSITYDSDRVQKFLQIELTYREVYTAMNIGASGRYSFSRAEIENKVSDYLSQKYLNIRSKGDLQIPEIVNKVIEQCFTPTRRASQELAALQVASLSYFKIGRATPRVAPPSNPPGSPPVSRGDNPAETPAPVTRDLQFSFKRELADRNEKFLFHQIHFEESQVTTVVSSYLTARRGGAQGTPEVRVEVLPVRVLSVQHNNRDQNPKRSGVQVRRGDQWTVQAVFTLAAQSLFVGNRMNTYRWETDWPSVEGDLYYRVGQGPWIPVNGRAAIGGDVTHEGELSFYLDKTSIWNKIPERFTKGDLGNLLPAIFTYPKTYPAFMVTLSGRRVSIAAE